MNSLKIKHTRVRKGKLDLEVICNIDNLRVTPEEADRILGLLPNLANHICVNASDNKTFGEELVGTEIPHLLEHIIIELQGRSSDRNCSFVGHTSWLEELKETAPCGHALMRTTVTFSNDFVALMATDSAVKIINWMINPATTIKPNIDEIVLQLKAIYLNC